MVWRYDNTTLVILCPVGGRTAIAAQIVYFIKMWSIGPI